MNRTVFSWLLVFLAPTGLVSMTGSAVAAPALSVELRCLESISSAARPVRLEFRTVFDPDLQWQGAYIRYKGQSSPITLAQVSRVADGDGDGRPWEYATVYNEIIDGRVNGKYVVVTQGARVYRFTYVNSDKTARTEFAEVPAAHTEAGCRWP